MLGVLLLLSSGVAVRSPREPDEADGEDPEPRRNGMPLGRKSDI